ncbi:MAG: thiamine phosphate synthase [Rhodospirillaceae bacterium]|nr:thiamine phosphate synthase [Rhodospirillaceae bacterium]MBT4485924.1 thiamine phosphate synthase [Rhodospirillaceae bacterium]MBT6428518.1 thiamine phosphate synthase [Rhodospirillaceae bacterium]
MSEAADRCRLYLITPPSFEPTVFAEDLRAALDGGDVACLQLRLKDAEDDAVRRAVEVLMPMAQQHDVAFLVNDRPDLAAEMGADGCHVGQEDTPYGEARSILGADHIVGVTCHASRHLAMEAGQNGADYVAFGAFFATDTKQAKATADLELLQWWSELFEVPCVAIGGITVDNCAPLVAAGADFLSVVAGVWSYTDGPAAAVRDFNKIIDGVT